MKEEAFKAFNFLLGFAILLYLSVPVALFIVTSDPRELAAALADPQVQESFAATFAIATETVVLSVALGVPLAYALARYEFPGKEAIRSLVEVPVLIPHTVAGIILLKAFGTRGYFGWALSALGLSVVDSAIGVLLAMTFVSAPLLVRTVEEAIKSVDVRYEFVARSLGASPAKAFFSVVLPLVSRSILAGALLAWARAVSEFGAIVILTYDRPMVASVLVYDRFVGYGLRASAPVAVLLVVMCLAIFVCVKLLQTKLFVEAFWQPTRYARG